MCKAFLWCMKRMHAFLRKAGLGPWTALTVGYTECSPTPPPALHTSLWSLCTPLLRELPKPKPLWPDLTPGADCALKMLPDRGREINQYTARDAASGEAGQIRTLHSLFHLLSTAPRLPISIKFYIFFTARDCTWGFPRRSCLVSPRLRAVK